MLRVEIPESEYFNEATSEFINIKGQTLTLEHSLISISKWESKWHKPFLGRDQKTTEEALDYVRCMTINHGVDPLVYLSIRPKQFEEINTYIEDKQTATWFNERGTRPSREIITSEIIYYWMISLQIPLECEKWHLNRLLALIKVCNIKNGSSKKMSKKEILSQNRSLNDLRRKQLGTNG